MLNKRPTNSLYVNEQDENGWAPLHSAASKGRTEVAQVLIDANAYVNANNSFKGPL